VSVLSTGTVQIRPEHVGPTRKNTYLWLATSQQWTEPRPINTYVIEHRNGLVLFDTGQDRRSVTDPGYFPGGLTGVIYDRLARFDIGPDQTLARQLATLGHRIGDVHTAALEPGTPRTAGRPRSRTVHLRARPVRRRQPGPAAHAGAHARIGVPDGPSTRSRTLADGR
jgi:hypothetical protein